MSDKQQEEKNIDLVELSSSISKKELGVYIDGYETQHGEMICPLCNNTNWGIPSNIEDKSKPAIVTLPLPNSSGRGMWAYPLVCTECGFLANFATNHVAKKIRGV